MQKISLNIPQPDITYDIEFLKTFSELEKNLKSQINGRNYIIITDENVFSKTAFFQNIKKSFLEENRILVLKPGEEEKTWSSIDKILEKSFKLELDRSSVFVAIGGGVIGDMTGFAASLFMRGVPVIQVPTTLLSMTDSSVGGKTGIDNKHGKNLVGAFMQPEKVICVQAFLETLPKVEIQNGLGEMIKHGIIASPNHFKHIKNTSKFWNQDEFLQQIFQLVPESVKIKKNIVEQDQKEAGIRGFLNLGHTYGHAIEQLSDFKIPHGRAVAIGCILATQKSISENLCDENLIKTLEEIFTLFEIDTKCEFKMDKILNAMTHDKKKKNGKIRLILPLEIGKVKYFDLQ